MSNTEVVATPGATEIQPGAGTDSHQEVVPPENATHESDAEENGTKPELTPEQKQIRALQRRVDRLTRDKYATRAELQQAQQQLRSASAQESGQQQDTEQRGFTEQDVERRVQEKIEIDRINAKANAIADAGEEAYSDFGAKVKAVMEELPLFDPKGKPLPVMEAIADCDKPEAVLYHLGQNPDLAAELAELSPARQARRIALIEKELPAPTDKPADKSKPAVSATPKPLKSEKPASSTTKSETDMSDAEWAAFKAEQRRKARS